MSIVGLEISYQVNGAEEGEAVLERIRVAFERTGDELAQFDKHVFPKLTPVFEAEMAKQFDAQGDGPRGQWEPLSPAYADWKERAFPGNPILVLSGKMREGLTSSASPYAARAFSSDTFSFGTQGVEYASFHQLGTPKMPDRPPFDFSADFERDLAEASLEGAREAVAAAGLDEFVEVVP